MTIYPLVEKDVHNGYGISERNITLKDLDAFPKAKALLNKITEARKSSKDRTVYSADYDFYVSTDNILMMENGAYHSLTFPIFRLQEDHTFSENLVLSLEDDGNYSAAIYKYKLTAENKTDLQNNQPTEITTPIKRTVLSNFNADDVLSDRIVTVFYTEIIIIPCGGVGHIHNGSNMGHWGECDSATKPRFLVITRMTGVDVPEDDALMTGSDVSGGGSGSGNPDYNPTSPFNPDRDFGLVNGHLTKPVITHEMAFWETLSDVQQDTMQDDTFREALLDFLDENHYSDESKAFAKLMLDYYNETEDLEFCEWAFEFMIENPEITSEEFENWYIESYDGPIEESINPENITFDEPIIQTSLPSLQSFVSAFPKKGTPGNYTQMPASEVYDLVGGSLLTSYNNNPNQYGNGCSIRGTRGLLYSNPPIHVPVTKYNGVQRTQKGGDGKNYILDATSFNKFMISKFGETEYKLEGPDANNPEKVATLLKGKSGIYVIVNNSSGTAGYNGHVDAIIDGKCIGGAYTRPSGGVKSIRVWVLE